jgi:N-acetylglucosaminyl-diphospho-decaprenol L-rhamnosyltransferase
VAVVDVVVVSFNSRDQLRECVEHLAGRDDIHVVIVDNASTDASLETVADLRVTPIPLDRNRGFASGCNIGWRQGQAPFVLFLNPDARITPTSLRRLTLVLEEEIDVALAAPRIAHTDGSLDFSQRRFPRLRSTFARALFLHRILPRAGWTDEVVRDDREYARGTSPEWVSGACMLVRRSALEEVDGFDEGFFLYGEDKDLCRRLRNAGYSIRYEPEATCVHHGGASAPRSALLPVLAASRLRYAQKHFSRPAATLERLGIALDALTHLVLSRGGYAARAGHARSLRMSASRTPQDVPSPMARDP